MGRKIAVGCVMAVSVLGFGAGSAAAQVFGTFTWQMQPYCNRVTLTLTSVTGNFTLDGSDDMCGGAKKASATGIGVFNPDGTVGINFTIVLPTGRAVNVAASVSPANGQGTWTDGDGNNGTFAFFGNTPALPARPAPASFGTINRRSATSSAISPGTSGSVGVQCNTGERVLSGGNDASSALNIVIVASRNDGANGWRVFARNDAATNNTVTVHAYCLVL